MSVTSPEHQSRGSAEMEAVLPNASIIQVFTSDWTAVAGLSFDRAAECYFATGPDLHVDDGYLYGSRNRHQYQA
jgi:hypothetical protein